MIYVDASVIVAILLREINSDAFFEAIERAGSGVSVSVAVYEASVAIARELSIPVNIAEEKVNRFLNDAQIKVISADSEITSLAIAAFGRFGKQQHPAKLNMGDCFAYAVASDQSVPILFKGNDFSQTDLAIVPVSIMPQDV